MIMRYDIPGYVCVPECEDCKTTEGEILPYAVQLGKYFCDSCWKKRVDNK